MNRRFQGLSLLLFLISPFSPLAAQLRISGEHAATGWTVARSIKGSVRLFSDGSPVANVRVVLAVFPELTTATTHTSGGGDFEFADLPEGDYQIIIDEPNYGSVHQPVAVRGGDVQGLRIYMHAMASRPPAPSGTLVSLRELSLARKARQAMGKGLDLLYRKSDYRASLTEFQRAIKEYAGYYEAYAQMGVAHMHLQDFASAEAALRKSIELSEGKYADAYLLLSALFSDAQRYAEAEPLARQALDIDPKRWQAKSELARALLGLGRLVEAEASAAAAVQLQPESPLLHLLLADIHIALKNPVALLNDLDNYLRLAPVGPTADQARATRDQVQQALAQANPAPHSQDDTKN
jgi:hypothetical protein